ncbi:OLC1v1038591C1 [Oldenlandia corymbosa var. corymbosa]|uniref:OLC1v1038591C1 n=1 Tax=Oldenlandia corymbosa var. corymbosa TaxID=529605 RepID=A0AAV1D1B0_OLDCO|nr:OLC1v1038591C1 [Oldenlandia corymbosa var. corymbosa]
MMLMERRRLYDQLGEIKKGPWKPEEDAVLLNHVRKYGPRDWSSIRSKGLLQRTGKSCRLRWVNKLRPNLKNGVKFSAEEERIVIDLQAQFGNKWAKIATYLTGRTDNDVKNFWSSRQKRLARILRTPAAASSSSSSHRSHRNKQAPVIHAVPTLEAPKFSFSGGEESSSQYCSMNYILKSEPIQMVPLPELIRPISLNYEHTFFPPAFMEIESKPSLEALPHLCFPQAPPQSQSEYTTPLENEDIDTNLGDPNYLEAFGNSSSSELGDVLLPFMPTCFELPRSPQVSQGQKDNSVTPDSLMDDFPIDIFDHIEPLPSPSDW